LEIIERRYYKIADVKILVLPTVNNFIDDGVQMLRAANAAIMVVVENNFRSADYLVPYGSGDNLVHL
jgi:hypothetical protein